MSGGNQRHSDEIHRKNLLGCKKSDLRTEGMSISSHGMSHSQDLSDTKVAGVPRHTSEENYVKMPCCFPSSDSTTEALRSLRTPGDVKEVIQKNYGTADCALLVQFIKDERKMDAVKRIGKLAASLHNEISQDIRCLTQGTSSQIILTRKQAACLLANAFFCTFDLSTDFNFIRLYSKDSSGRGTPEQQRRQRVEKLKCLFAYFDKSSKSNQKAKICFQRVSDSNPPKWSDSKKTLTQLCVCLEGNIEEQQGMLQVDFANKTIGGGVLGNGLVQEEIRFITCPEMIVARLFSDDLTDKEALIIKGCAQYSLYRGYSDGFRFVRPKDNLDTSSEVVAIDAVSFRGKQQEQFKKGMIDRELNKAYVGFKPSRGVLNAVATGHWGCGAFEGNKELKAILQLLAASQCGRQVCYFSWDEHDFSTKLVAVHERMDTWTVGEVYNKVLEFSKDATRGSSLFKFLLQQTSVGGTDSIPLGHGHTESEAKDMSVDDIRCLWEKKVKGILKEIDAMSLQEIEEAISTLKKKISA